MLTNPAYAGVYVFGRTRTGRRLDETGRVVVSKTPVRDVSCWGVAIHNHHPGYISWETFQANQARLAADDSAPRERAGVRSGKEALSCKAFAVRSLRSDDAVGYSGRAAPAGSASPGRSSRYICFSADAYSTDAGTARGRGSPYRSGGDRGSLRCAGTGRVGGHRQSFGRSRNSPG